MDYAAAVNEEIRDLFAAGADVVQIDEPYMQARPEKARQYGLRALNRALDGIDGHDRGAHLLRLRRDHPRAAVAATRSCPSWRGCSCKQVSIETAQSKPRLRGPDRPAGQADHAGLPRPDRPDRRDAARPSPPRAARARHVAAERLVLAPDCGMKYLPREVAFGKMRAMVAAARILRSELAREAR